MAYENVTPPALPEYMSAPLTITWNGIPTGVYFDYDDNPNSVYKYYKVSDRVFGIDELSGASCEYNSGETGSYVVGTVNSIAAIAYSSSSVPSVVSAKSGGYGWQGYNLTLPEDGTYLYRSKTGTSYIKSVTIPSAAASQYVLVFDYGAKESDWYQVHLYYSATAFTYNGSVATNTGVVFKQVYDDSIGAWTDYGELSEAVNLSPGLKDGVYQRIYTNHNILDGNGDVWLAADSVTPVEETGVTEEWLFSFKTGLALGLCGKALYTVPPAHIWDEKTGSLIVNRDDGSLHFEFDQNTFNMTVIQQY